MSGRRLIRDPIESVWTMGDPIQGRAVLRGTTLGRESRREEGYLMNLLES